LVAILAVSFFIRLGLTLEHSGSPLFDHLRIDEVSYHDWSTEVMEGRYFLDVVPNHGPGYPWVVGTLYHLFGESMWTHRVLNIILGTASVFLVFLVGSELFRRRSALVAALLFGLYWPLMIFEQRMLATSMFVFLCAAGLYLVILAARKERWYLWAPAGAIIGYGALVRPTAAVFLGLVCLWLLVRAAWKKKPRLIMHAALLLLAGAIFIVPVSAVHHSISGEGFMVHINAGLNLYIGNNPQADGTPYARLTGAWEKIESMPVKEAGIYDASEQDRFFTGKVFSYLKDKPLDFLLLQLKKAGLFLNRAEPRATFDPLFHRSLFFISYLPLPGFAVIMAFFLPGLSAIKPRQPAHQALLVYLLGFFFFTVATVVASRYRAVAVPSFCAVSGAGAVLLYDSVYGLIKSGGKLPAKEKRNLAVLSVLAVVGAGTALLPPAPSHDRSEEYTYLGDAWNESGDAERAFNYYEKALEADPQYSPALLRIGDLQAEAKRYEEALRWYEKAADAGHGNSLAHFRLGFVYWRLGMPYKSVDHLSKTVEARPQWVPGLWQLALREWRIGLEERARNHLRIILKLRPAHTDARNLLEIIEKGVKPPPPPRYDKEQGKVVSPLEKGWRPGGKP